MSRGTGATSGTALSAWRTAGSGGPPRPGWTGRCWSWSSCTRSSRSRCRSPGYPAHRAPGIAWNGDIWIILIFWKNIISLKIKTLFSQNIHLPVYHSEGDQGGVLQVLLAQPRPDELTRRNLLNREVLSCQRRKWYKLIFRHFWPAGFTDQGQHLFDWTLNTLLLPLLYCCAAADECCWN